MTSRTEASPKARCVFFDADARAVVTAARDCIHYGWRLVHHPLYGNYRPYQQPYRSLVLTSPASDSARPDEVSLRFIEEALLVYNGNKVLAPAEAPPSLLDACALLDYELMRLPLEQSGLIPDGYAPPLSPERREELSQNLR